MTRLDDLDALVAAATPGPWFAGEEAANWDLRGVPLAAVIGGTVEPEDVIACVAAARQKNAAFIAACDPTTIRKLIAVVRAVHGFTPLLSAVIAIWEHTERHTTYVEGVGYTSRSDQQRCEEPDEHSRLAAAEGKAWFELRNVQPVVSLAGLGRRMTALRSALEEIEK